MSEAALYLIDGTGIAYRAYFAFIRSPLYTSKGLNTSAVFGVARWLLELREEREPDRIVCALDAPGPTFRHEAFPEYKATREKMPDEMAEQLPYLDRLLEAFRIPTVSVSGVEADDVIGTLARRAARDGDEVRIVSGDKDLAQLVSERIHLLDPFPGTNRPEEVGPEEVEDRWGVPPDRIVDAFALAGDSSDNIPGVPGVGEKRSATLVTEIGDLDAILDRPEEVPWPSIREALAEHGETARRARELIRIRTDVELPPEVEEADLSWPGPDLDALHTLFLELEFRSLLDELPTTAGAGGDADAAPAVDRPVRVIRETDDVDALRSALAGEGPVGVHGVPAPAPSDARAPGRTHRLTGLGIAVDEEAFYLPLGSSPVQHTLFGGATGGEEGPLRAARSALEEPLAAGRAGATGAKALLHALPAVGIPEPRFGFDPALASYLIDPSLRARTARDLARRFLRAELPAMPDEPADAPTETVARAAGASARACLRLRSVLSGELERLEMGDLLSEVELPLVPILARMEERGVAIDAGLLAEVQAAFRERIDSLAAEIEEAIGHPLNLASPTQLSTALFEELAIHEEMGLRRPRKTSTGWSTSQEALEPFEDHPLIGKVLRHRSLEKLRGTYIDVLPDLVDPETGRIHTTLHQTTTQTGRLSSSEPNLQNIPVRTPEGRRIREAFVPRGADRVLLSADYSQIELRILAHLSADEALAAAFREGEDIHVATAARVFDLPEGEVTPLHRGRAKAINYGVVYGMGARRLARETDLDVDEARAFIEGYFESFPGVEAYIDRMVERARDQGAVETLLGRRRLLPEIRSSRRGVRAQAERLAVNTPIQGSAADLIKVAMIAIEDRLRAEHPEALLVLQVHDELLLDVPEAELEPVRDLVRQEMEGAIELDVPVEVDAGAGPNWLVAHG